MSLLQFQKRKFFALDFEGSVAIIFNESINDESFRSQWMLNDVLSLYLGYKQFFARGATGECIFYDCKKKHVKTFPDQAPLAY